MLAATRINMAKSNTDTAGPERSEKYLLGEKMVVEFLGKPYQLGVRRMKLPFRYRKPGQRILMVSSPSSRKATYSPRL